MGESIGLLEVDMAEKLLFAGIRFGIFARSWRFLPPLY